MLEPCCEKHACMRSRLAIWGTHPDLLDDSAEGRPKRALETKRQRMPFSWKLLVLLASNMPVATCSRFLAILTCCSSRGAVEQHSGKQPTITWYVSLGDREHPLDV